MCQKGPCDSVNYCSWLIKPHPLSTVPYILEVVTHIGSNAQYRLNPIKKEEPTHILFVDSNFHYNDTEFYAEDNLVWNVEVELNEPSTRISYYRPRDIVEATYLMVNDTHVLSQQGRYSQPHWWRAGECSTWSWQEVDEGLKPLFAQLPTPPPTTLDDFGRPLPKTYIYIVPQVTTTWSQLAPLLRATIAAGFYPRLMWPRDISAKQPYSCKQQDLPKAAKDAMPRPRE